MARTYKIAIIQYDKGAVYDIPKEAFKAELKQLGLQVKYVEYNCNRRLGMFADALIEDMLSQKPDLIFSLGTGITEYLAGVRGGKPIQVKHKITNIPVVFAAVTNPVLSGIVKDWNSSGNNFTGASVFFPTAKLFETLRRAGPYKKVLVPLDGTGLGCTIASEQEIKQIEKKYNFKMITVYGNNALDVQKTIMENNLQFDSIAVLYDNIAIEALASGVLEKFSVERRAPIISVLTFLKNHAVFSYGADFNENGRVAARMVYRILVEGKDPRDIPIYRVRRPYFVINLKMAKKLGMHIPPSLLSRADEIVK